MSCNFSRPLWTGPVHQHAYCRCTSLAEKWDQLIQYHMASSTLSRIFLEWLWWSDDLLNLIPKKSQSSTGMRPDLAYAKHPLPSCEPVKSLVGTPGISVPGGMQGALGNQDILCLPKLLGRSSGTEGQRRSCKNRVMEDLQHGALLNILGSHTGPYYWCSQRLILRWGIGWWWIPQSA